MALTKNEIVDSMYRKLNLPKRKCADTVTALLEIMKRTLVNGEEIMISRFGKFSVRSKNARIGRNPQTGQGLMLRPRKVVIFKSSEVLRDRVNGRR
ncbi:MAG: integration host factor subunit alpha [Thermodesulfobacteriota bacterium]|nr:integration host factor subunit alpha [Thermodesulfobacteriota bacterium]